MSAALCRDINRSPYADTEADAKAELPVAKTVVPVEKSEPVGKGKSESVVGEEEAESVPLGKGKGKSEPVGKGKPVGKGSLDPLAEQSPPTVTVTVPSPPAEPVGKLEETELVTVPVGKLEEKELMMVPVAKLEETELMMVPVGKLEETELMMVPLGNEDSVVLMIVPEGNGESEEMVVPVANTLVLSPSS